MLRLPALLVSVFTSLYAFLTPLQIDIIVDDQSCIQFVFGASDESLALIRSDLALLSTQFNRCSVVVYDPHRQGKINEAQLKCAKCIADLIQQFNNVQSLPQWPMSVTLWYAFSPMV